MTRTITTAAFAATLALLSPRLAFSQADASIPQAQRLNAADPTPAVPDDGERFTDVDARLRALEKSVKTLSTRVKRLEADGATLSARIDKHDLDMAATDERIMKLTAVVEKNTQSITEMDKSIQRLTAEAERVAGNLRDNNEKLDHISRYDGESKRYVPNILGNQKLSRSFRNETLGAVTARIVIENNFGVDRFVTINGVRWRAIPGRSYAPVAHGPVTVATAGAAPVPYNAWRFDDRGYFMVYSIPGGFATNGATVE